MPTTDFNLDHLKHFRFTELFNELGWDLPIQQQPFSIAVGTDTWLLDVVAVKKGVQVLHCPPTPKAVCPTTPPARKLREKSQQKRCTT